EVAANLPDTSAALFDATVPNERGAQRAIDAGFRAITVFVSASDVGSTANVGKGTAASMAEAGRSIRLAAEHGVTTIGTVSKAFGSPYGDEIPAEAVLGLIEQYRDAGVS